jgi:hypothetical protein
MLHPKADKAATIGYILRFLSLVYFVLTWACVRWLIQRTFFSQNTSAKKQIVISIICALIMLPTLAALKHTFTAIPDAFTMALGFLGLSSAYQTLEQRGLLLLASPVRILSALLLGYTSLFILWGGHALIFISFALFPSLLEGASAFASALFRSNNHLSERMRRLSLRLPGVCLTIAAVLPGLLGVLGFVSKHFLLLTLLIPVISQIKERYTQCDSSLSEELLSETFALCILLFLSAIVIGLLAMQAN